MGFAELNMEAAAATTLVQSPFSTCVISNSTSRSVKVTANRTSFLSFGSNFGLPVKVILIRFDFLFVLN